MDSSIVGQFTISLSIQQNVELISLVDSDFSTDNIETIKMSHFKREAQQWETFHPRYVFDLGFMIEDILPEWQIFSGTIFSTGS